MERWHEERRYNISWYGINATQVTQQLYDEVMDKIREYTRGPPVRAKVVIVQRSVSDTYDSIGILRVRTSLYLVGITNSFLIMVDLHYVKNEIVSMFLDHIIDVD